MDTSKEYIKMCEVRDIQLHRFLSKDWQKGDWFVRANTAWIDVVFHQINFTNLPIPRGTIWLPRQDQLQEMAVDKDDILPWTLLSRFIRWTHTIYTHDFGETSMEQLWLAFVMKEKFNKEWRSDTWKKVS